VTKVLPGISGTLLPGTFLDHHLDRLTVRPLEHATRTLDRWWRRVERLLGPASALRVLADVGAITLADQFDLRVLQLEPIGPQLIGTLGSPRA